MEGASVPPRAPTSPTTCPSKTKLQKHLSCICILRVCRISLPSAPIRLTPTGPTTSRTFVHSYSCLWSLERGHVVIRNAAGTACTDILTRVEDRRRAFGLCRFSDGAHMCTTSTQVKSVLVLGQVGCIDGSWVPPPQETHSLWRERPILRSP